MEDNGQDKDLKKTKVNIDEVRKHSGHTWIGDKDEIRPDAAIRPVSRATITDGEVRTTKVVERQRRPYTGFITEEELKHAQAVAEIDRMSRAESQAAREKMAQTRVYSGIGSGLDGEEETETKAAVKKPRVRRTFTLRIDDAVKIRRLAVMLGIIVLLIAFEISFFVMRASTTSLPGKTEEVRTQTEEVTAENEKIESETETLGDYDEITESRDSWKKIKDQLAK